VRGSRDSSAGGVLVAMTAVFGIVQSKSIWYEDLSDLSLKYCADMHNTWTLAFATSKIVWSIGPVHVRNVHSKPCGLATGQGCSKRTR